MNLMLQHSKRLFFGLPIRNNGGLCSTSLKPPPVISSRPSIPEWVFGKTSADDNFIEDF